ncbi:MAG: glycosyltransferase family 4 protein [Azospirillaceae bacterium]
MRRWRRIAVTPFVALSRLAGLPQALVVTLSLSVALALNPGFFDARHYRRRYGTKGLRRFPRLEFVLNGARRLRDPNEWFSQTRYLEHHPRASTIPPVLHYLARHKSSQIQPAAAPPPAPPARPDAQAPPPVVAAAAPTDLPPAALERFDALWPALRDDLHGLRDVANQITPTTVVRERLRQVRPASAPPAWIGIARQALADLPARVDHMLLLPWMNISGGAERATKRLLEALVAHYGDQGLCIFAPEHVFDVPPGERAIFGMPIVAINDYAPKADFPTRLAVLLRVLVESKPAVLHCGNSLVGWSAIREYGTMLARDSKLFANIYSDIRLFDGVPVGFFWQFFPEALDAMTGVITDNQTVIDRAEAHFGYLPEQMAKLHPLPTPVIGLDGADARAELRAFRDPGIARSLWLSRIAIEKRLDVLQRIAAALPEREFALYGGRVEQATPVDLNWLGEQPNVTLHGAFADLSAIPADRFDSYVFTTSAEGMPIALLEAARLGLPIVAPDVGGIGEFIDESTGWLVSGPEAIDEYVAALRAIRSDPAEAGRRVAAAQERLVERHSRARFEQVLHAIPGYLHGRHAAS